MYNLTTTSSFGGVETFVWEASRELARRGEQVHILGGKGDRREDIPNVSVQVFPFFDRRRIPNWGRRFRKLLERLSMGPAALKAIRREKYDILHIHKPFDLPLGSWAKRKSGSRLILGSHGTDFFPGDRLFASGVDAAVSCSRFNATLLKARYGLDAEVIYNGFNPERFQSGEGQDPGMRMRFGFSPSDFVLVYAGRLIGLKGIKFLLRAISRVPERLPLKVLIVGEGEEEAALKELGRGLGIDKKIAFTGFVPHYEIPAYLQCANLAVYPSLADEAFGLSICEAMACALPVIATRVGGIPELIEDEKTGFLVEPRDEIALANRIEKLLRNPAEAKEVGRRAAARVRELFTWEKVGERMLRVYRRVLDTGKGS
jgi:glycosyltransferase involved in cell wall biosynthesis